jgi:hypothetical protein
VSVGAASHLAAADLCDRLGTDRVRIVNYGDLVRDSPDPSYTGFDNFRVILTTDQTVYFYLVSATGEVSYIGDGVPQSRDTRLPGDSWDYGSAD